MPAPTSKNNQKEPTPNGKTFAEFEFVMESTLMARASDLTATQSRIVGELTIDQVKENHYKIDAFKWLRDEATDDPDELPEPEELITEAMEELQLAHDALGDMQRLFEGDGDET